MGRPTIDAEVDRAPLLPHVVHLGLHGYTTVPGMLGNDPSEVPSVEVRIPTINGQPVTGVFNVNLQVMAHPMPRSVIGIGSGSDLLLRVGGQIDFVRQSTEGGILRFEGTEQEFINNDCLPDSIMRIQTVILWPDAIGGIPRGVETRIGISIGDTVFAIDSVTALDSQPFVVTMPYSWIAGIVAMLPDRIDRYPTVFTDCARTMQRLPIITLTFTAGGLRLLPEDYTRPTGQDDTCAFLIGGIDEDFFDQTIRFNPLLIPGINARSTDSEIILCDSAAIAL